jgi:cytochrome c5
MLAHASATQVVRLYFRAVCRTGCRKLWQTRQLDNDPVSNPVSKTDLVFLKHFSLIIGMLMLVTVALIGLAMHLYTLHPPSQSPEQGKDVAARIAPVAEVYAGDTGRAAMAQAQDAAKKLAATQVAYGGTLDGKVIFGNLCQSCHTTGAGGAPLMEKALWAPRVAQGLSTLVEHAINGYNGKAGSMPAKGGNASLTDAQIKATVEWMVAQVK